MDEDVTSTVCCPALGDKIDATGTGTSTLESAYDDGFDKPVPE